MAQNGIRYSPTFDFTSSVEVAYKAADTLTEWQAIDLAHIALGLGSTELAHRTDRSVSTLGNNQQAIANKLILPNDKVRLSVAAHASGWFSEIGRHLVAQEKPYAPERLKIGENVLSPQERQVLSMRASGLGAAETSRGLLISALTTKNHQAAIMNKLLSHNYPRTMHVAISACWVEGLVSVEAVDEYL